MDRSMKCADCATTPMVCCSGACERTPCDDCIKFMWPRAQVLGKPILSLAAETGSVGGSACGCCFESSTRAAGRWLTAQDWIHLYCAPTHTRHIGWIGGAAAVQPEREPERGGLPVRDWSCVPARAGLVDARGIGVCSRYGYPRRQREERRPVLSKGSSVRSLWSRMLSVLVALV